MSKFQLLPLRTIKHIIRYSLDTFSYSYRLDIRAPLSLLHSCRSWRLAFINAAFDSLAIETSDEEVLGIRFSKCCNLICPLEYPVDRLVKSLSITFRNWGDVLSGDVEAWMKRSGLSETRLPRLHSFDFNVYNPPPHCVRGDLDVPQDMHRIVSFFQLLHEMMPSVRSVAFEKAAVGWHISDKEIDELIKAQVIDLLRNVNSVRFGCYGISTYLQNTDIFTGGNLTLLSYRHRYNLDTTSFLKIVRLNAANIISLDIDSLSLTYVKDIVTCDTGEPLVYPCLSLLRLTNIYRPSTQWPPLSDELTDSPSNVNHFPTLKTLDLSGGLYPFKYNFLGSNSNNTLETLNACYFSLDVSEYLFSFLMSTRFIKLKSFALLSPNVIDTTQSRTITNKKQEDDVANLMQSLLQNSLCLSKFASTLPVGSSLFLDNALCIRHNYLRYLDVDHTVFSFSNILQIIYKYPYLKRLTCRLDDNPPNIEGVASNALLQHIHTLYPINDHFVELRVKQPSRTVVESHVKTAILLAIGCPNFSIIVFEDHDSIEICGLIEFLLKSESYTPYAIFCENLIDRMNRNCAVETANASDVFSCFE